MKTCCKEKFDGCCCCNCIFHIEDFNHCVTAITLRDEMNKCVCDSHKGWICMPPGFRGAHSGWSEHGICEMHTITNQDIHPEDE